MIINQHLIHQKIHFHADHHNYHLTFISKSTNSCPANIISTSLLLLKFLVSLNTFSNRHNKKKGIHICSKMSTSTWMPATVNKPNNFFKPTNPRNFISQELFQIDDSAENLPNTHWIWIQYAVRNPRSSKTRNYFIQWK